ncbi:ATP-grasp domain-containing protein [Paraflavitalea sp. CAU 1676]|uniref:ATP-grasp domain-containing protein n=1 Tax=Paraflavitalea sp. CAU 1676 TaxID=3032598 RepID=UPI0023D9BBFC|nr:ATP-grasp domain-containing protein [Paraflavitalea sp. CAU 1676]MDF2192939.1 ATP-grasp domain-containing protein [Paraflavitalea sp. CAU 1676]
MASDTILIIPEKTDIEFDEVLSIWTANGGRVKRLGKYWIKDEELTASKLVIYGNQTFALVLAQIYNLDLISPDDALITRLDKRWTKRDITLTQIGKIDGAILPAFIKPVIPKLFVAGSFSDLNAFNDATKGLQTTEEVMVSNIITDITAEARSYVKSGVVMDIALYEGTADTEEARLFLEDFLTDNHHQLPAVVVVDLAYSSSLGWFVLEFNACWGAGLNHCKAEKVIDCMKEATINK